MNEQERIKEIKERLGALGYTVLKIMELNIKVPLTEDELKAIATEMGIHIIEGHRLENEKKAITKALGDKQKDEEASAQALATTYKNGFEEREENCMIAADFEGKVRRIFSIRTGLQVGQELLQDSDKQTVMPMDELAAKRKKDKPAKPEVLGIGFERDSNDLGEIEVDGIVIEKGDIMPDQDQEVEIEAEVRIVTQIRKIEKNGKVWTMTTAEGIKLFADEKAFAQIAEQNKNANMAGAERGEAHYVEVEFLETKGDGPKQITAIRTREIPSTGIDMDVEPIDGFEEGDDDL